MTNLNNFEISVQYVLKNEGGYCNHPSDPGGATNFGISLRFLKSTDEYINATIDTIKNLKCSEAIQIYKKYFWEPNNYDKINNLYIACKIFDMCVNMGAKNANKLAQRAVNSANHLGNFLSEDGIIGEKSIIAINECAPNALLASLKSESANYYRSLRNDKFLSGWLKRAHDSL